MSELALELIKENKRTKDTFLDLGRCGLKNYLPEELGDCIWLERLNFGNSYLKFKNDEIVESKNRADDNEFNGKELKILGKLKNLKFLDLFGVKLKNITFLQKLKQILTLDLGRNQIFNFTPLENLTQLDVLDISVNQCQDYSFFKNLSQLRYLDLHENKTQDLSFLQNLSNLETLNINSVPIQDFNCLQNLNQLQNLHLANCEVQNIDFLRNLKGLRHLDLSSNQIADISVLENLRQLQFLDLSYNQIVDISVLENLSQLHTLELTSNKIKDISFLQNLSQLQALSLNENQVFEIGCLQNLKQLEVLQLSANKIKNISFSNELRRLERLFLSENQISIILPKLLDKLPKLRILHLFDNPIENIPAEIFDREYQNVFKEVKDYFLSIHKTEDVFPLHEAKLILVGRGFVGKSELVETITDKNYQFEEGRKQTEGIRIKEWFPSGFKKNNKKINFKVNIWDFGGQEIYYGTHQFFLSKNAVYLLVWDARQEEDTRTFDYWLRAIGLLSEQSPVIIVQNKADLYTKELNQEDIKKNFPFVKGFYQTSCKAPNQFDNQRLNEQIAKELLALPHIGEPWNKHRIAVRKKLEQDTRNYMPEEEYLGICKANGLKDEEPFFLSDRLHHLGVILHFQNDDLLKRTIILKPEWATSAFYKIIDNKRIKEEQGGCFSKQDLTEIWNDSQYKSMMPELVQLMKRFELCFQYQNQDKYIVPEISSANPSFDIPSLAGHPSVLEFVYQYEFMPKSIITRFICRNHKYIHQDMFWKSGVVLGMDGCLVVVESSEINKKISIKISGQAASKVLFYIRKDIDFIHDTVKNPKYDELVPCKSEVCKNSSQPYYFKYKTLIAFQQEGDDDIRCETCRKKMKMDELLEGIKKELFEEIGMELLKGEKIIEVFRNHFKNQDMNISNIGLKIIRIFIASSFELEKDRVEFRTFISVENDRLVKKGIYLEVVQWEYIFEAISDTRKQDDYNKHLKTCDLMVCLFGTKVGKFTKEEFDEAYNHFKATGSPKIFTYFKKMQIDYDKIDGDNLKSYQDFKTYLKSIEHFQSDYADMNDFKVKFKRNLDEYLAL